jgi:tripartite-type tricarboxylate transporter receptor subunit TctC
MFEGKSIMGSRKRKVFFPILVVFVILSGMSTFASGAQDAFPSKPITVIVPFPAGGSTDIAVRRIAPYVRKYLNASIIIENLPGADGAIGYYKGYSAKPDGYTLLASNTVPLFLTEYSRDVKYKTLDFKPIYAYARDSMILVVHPDFSKTADEFIKTARAQTVKIGTTGAATTTGLLGILFAEELGLKVNWVPFGGGAESLTTLAGKHIDAVFSIASSTLSLVKAGKIKALLVFSEQRHPQYPDVQVPKEVGVNIPLLFNHTGLVGPPDLPENKIQILAKAFIKAGEDPEYVTKLKETGTSELVPLSPKEYKQEFHRLYSVTEKYKKYLRK